jgi:hypothetical protein
MNRNRFIFFSFVFVAAGFGKPFQTNGAAQEASGGPRANTKWGTEGSGLNRAVRRDIHVHP